VFNLDAERQKRLTMRRISIVGVITGGVVDIVATNIATIPLMIYVMSSLGSPHISQSQLSAKMLTALHENPGLYAVQMAGGLGSSLLGGYVAALIAKREEILNGFLSSWLCVAFGIYGFTSGLDALDSSPWYVKAMLSVLGPICALLGGYLRLTQKKRALSNAQL